MEWEDGDLSRYNPEGKARYDIWETGKVDISFEKEGKISLTARGMCKLVNDWLSETDPDQIKKEKKDELIKLLKR